MKKVSIIIPCFNEIETIREIVSRVSKITLPPDWTSEIIIVDDGSTDGTTDILNKYKEQHLVVCHPKNLGKGSAVKTGINKASGDYLIIQDADLEYNPNEIPSLIETLRDNTNVLVYGSRNLHHIKRRGMYIPRLGVWLITQEFNFLYNTKLTDIWTCYKLFPQSAKEFFVAGRFESELVFTAKTVRAGYKIVEVPISHKPRTNSGGKKIKYRDGINGIIVLIKEYFR